MRSRKRNKNKTNIHLAAPRVLLEAGSTKLPATSPPFSHLLGKLLQHVDGLTSLRQKLNRFHLFVFSSSTTKVPTCWTESASPSSVFFLPSKRWHYQAGSRGPARRLLCLSVCLSLLASGISEFSGQVKVTKTAGLACRYGGTHLDIEIRHDSEEQITLTKGACYCCPYPERPRSPSHTYQRQDRYVRKYKSTQRPPLSTCKPSSGTCSTCYRDYRFPGMT